MQAKKRKKEKKKKVERNRLMDRNRLNGLNLAKADESGPNGSN